MGCAEQSCPSLRLCCQRGTGWRQRWMCIELRGLASQMLHPHAHLFSYNVFLIPAFEFACILNCIICIAMPELWLNLQRCLGVCEQTDLLFLLVSQNPRMFWIGRNLKAHHGPTPCHGRDSLGWWKAVALDGLSPYFLSC